VSPDRGQPNLRVECPRVFDDGSGLRSADVRFAQQHRPREVVQFDTIEIEDVDRSDAQEAKRLDHFVADRAGADDDEVAGLQRILREAGDGAMAAVAIAGRHDALGRHAGGVAIDAQPR